MFVRLTVAAAPCDFKYIGVIGITTKQAKCFFFR